MERNSIIDVAIIGSGIVGLATAREISERYPKFKMCILEKEQTIAKHQTSHSSGVIHSGIYYQEGSAKAKFSIEGRTELIQFCKDNGIPYEVCGKVIVATDEKELASLEKLLRRGLQNGIPDSDLEIIGGEKLHDLEPHSFGLGALHIRTTGIVGYSLVAQTMAEQFRQRDGQILTDTKVVGIYQKNNQIELLTTNDQTDSITTKYLINCAGLHADTVASMMGVKTDVKIIPFRGEYYSLIEEARHLVNNLIYPVPDPNLPFLGVHLTRTINGEVEAGPNAVLAFAKEGYKKSDVKLEELLDIVRFEGFRKIVQKYWKVGLDELMRSYSKRLFTHSLQKLVPEIEEKHLQPFTAGVRAQAVASDGSLVNDFLIKQFRNSLHVLNAPSPAATASFSIARYIANMAKPTLDNL